ncbi:hypothetical protein D3C83_329030 [compost metagenome]
MYEAADLRTGGFVHAVGKGRCHSCASLDRDLVPGFDQPAHTLGHERDSSLVFGGFL